MWRDEGAHPPVGEQLELDLPNTRYRGWEPWEGVTPRGLTRAFVKFSLGAHPAGGLHAESCAEHLHRVSEVQLQLDLFL